MLLVFLSQMLVTITWSLVAFSVFCTTSIAWSTCDKYHNCTNQSLRRSDIAIVVVKRGSTWEITFHTNPSRKKQNKWSQHMFHTDNSCINYPYRASISTIHETHKYRKFIYSPLKGLVSKVWLYHRHAHWPTQIG